MRFFFVTALLNIRIPGDLGRGDKINDGTFITNQPDSVSKHLTPGFERVAGSLETDFIRRAPAVVYSFEDRSDETEPEGYLLEKLMTVSTFLNALWLVKDNAVNNDLGFATYVRNGTQNLDSNSHTVKYSTAAGTTALTEFTREELREARRLFREQFGVSSFVKSGSTAAVSSSGRLQHALYFVSGARANRDIGLKVADYCSALEALFASSHLELTHQLSERTAAFLEDEPRKRVDLYFVVKKAYSIRSIVVHGDITKPAKSREFVAAAGALDDILRRIFLKLFTEQIPRVLVQLEQEDFNRDFLLKVFGASWKDLVEEEYSIQGPGKNRT